MAKKRNPKEGNIVKNWDITSFSDPNTVYKIVLCKDGSYQCSCPAWESYPGDCKHIKDIKLQGKKVLKTWTFSGRKDFTISLLDNGIYTCTCYEWTKKRRECPHARMIKAQVRESGEEKELLSALYYGEITEGQDLTIEQLASQAAEGKVYLAFGAVGSGGYGFVIRNVEDFKEIDEIYDTFSYQTYEEVGDMHQSRKDRKKKDRYSDRYFQSLYEINALLIGSLKTLVPSLKFWDVKDSDILFEACVIVKTPKGKIFPLIYYYDRYRMALGTIPKVDLEIFNFDPLKLSQEERFELAEAFENALKKAPVTDYKTIYPGHDEPWSIGVRDGKPYFRPVYY